MKNIRSTITSTLLTYLLVCILCISASAQKLPNKQEVSVRAPADIKIDGKTTEWHNQLQAYNHATDVFYTLSNDDVNLYLTVQATDMAVIKKIMNGGVSFTINTTGKKNDNGAVSITYPVFSRKNKPSINLGGKYKFSDASKVSPAEADSFMVVFNRSLREKSKYIMVTGLKDVDTLQSVYNAEGIKAAQAFDNKLAYTYELAIDLKHLGLSTANAARFAYHITLNGTSIANLDAVEKQINDQVISVSTIPRPDIMGMKIMLDNQGDTAPTDFWGEYILVK